MFDVGEHPVLLFSRVLSMWQQVVTAYRECDSAIM
jgi:hypothetical protein